jgi:hypothetical protein
MRAPVSPPHPAEILQRAAVTALTVQKNKPYSSV